MFVLCWSNERKEGWELVSKEELQKKVYEIMEKEGCSPEDMMVFNYREDYLVPEESGLIIL